MLEMNNFKYYLHHIINFEIKITKSRLKIISYKYLSYDSSASRGIPELSIDAYNERVTPRGLARVYFYSCQDMTQVCKLYIF